MRQSQRRRGRGALFERGASVCRDSEGKERLGRAGRAVTLPEIEKAYVVADLGLGNPISGCSVPANNSTARRSYQATILAAVFPQATLKPGIIQTDRRRNLLMARRTARRGPCASHAFLCRYRRPRVPHMNMTTEEFEMWEGGYEPDRRVALRSSLISHNNVAILAVLPQFSVHYVLLPQEVLVLLRVFVSSRGVHRGHLASAALRRAGSLSTPRTGGRWTAPTIRPHTPQYVIFRGAPQAAHVACGRQS
eukprot:scaffold75324_cov69-Phaeocystis_antarctica.AAC.3